MTGTTVHPYINLRRSRDCRVIWLCVGMFVGMFVGVSASFTYFGQLLYTAHKRIVNIMKVYINRNNIQVELIRFRKN